MLKIAVVFCLATLTNCQVPIDFAYYHDLHLPHSPPLHPTLAREAVHTVFSCYGRARGYYADLDTGCQAYHFCWHQRLVATDLCANGTLFNEQFQVCDHFYNVRCGSPFEDL
ncbi:U-scoloptoxin(01)-Cw1a-like isoform X2 [Leguminivora glycinivorella]|uniref:U-scoloptoxin(01)-Cw1a-like isoform X2 n=1 Tax=Leguminivora glycinivorella TaxID=1035111 RepID=UPI00200E07B2|nr:U-scoloptoxin(01)-Cw1a-like isoform X2 [Leguminivora glycinivorella]